MHVVTTADGAGHPGRGRAARRAAAPRCARPRSSGSGRPAPRPSSRWSSPARGPAGCRAGGTPGSPTRRWPTPSARRRRRAWSVAAVLVATALPRRHPARLQGRPHRGRALGRAGAGRRPGATGREGAGDRRQRDARPGDRARAGRPRRRGDGAAAPPGRAGLPRGARRHRRPRRSSAGRGRARTPWCTWPPRSTWSGRWADYRARQRRGHPHRGRGLPRGRVARLVHVSSPSVAHAGRRWSAPAPGRADPKPPAGTTPGPRRWPSTTRWPPTPPGWRCWRSGRTWSGARRHPAGRPVVERARAGRLPLIGSGAALIDTTYVDNAVDALVAAVDACGRARRGTGGVQRRAAAGRRDPGPGVPRGRGARAAPAGAVPGRGWRGRRGAWRRLGGWPAAATTRRSPGSWPSSSPPRTGSTSARPGGAGLGAGVSLDEGFERLAKW